MCIYNTSEYFARIARENHSQYNIAIGWIGFFPTLKSTTTSYTCSLLRLMQSALLVFRIRLLLSTAQLFELNYRLANSENYVN